MSSPTSSPMSTSKKRKFDERLAESSTANANAQASSVVATDPTTITESESKSKSGSESESESESEYEYEPEPDEGQSPRNYLPITQGVRSPTRTVPATRARPVNRASYFAVPASLRPANVLGRVRGLLPPWFRRQRPVQRPRPQTQVILVGSLIKSTKRVALDVSRPSAHPFVPNSLPERPRQSIQAGPSNAQLQHDVVMNEAGPSNAQLQHDVDMNEAGPSNAQLQNDVDMNEVALSNAQLQHEFDIAQARPSNAQLQHDVDSTQAGSPNAQLQHVNDSTQAGSPNAQLQHDVDNTQAASSNGQLQHDADSAQAASSNGQLQHDADSAQAASSNGQLQHDADNTQPGPSNGQLQHDIDSAQPGPSNGQLQHDIDSSQAAPSNDQLQHDIELDDRNDYLDDTAGTQTWWRAAVNEETSDDEASIRPSFGRQGQVIPHVLPVAAIYKAARRDVVKSLQSRRWPMGRPTEHAIESRLKDRIFQLITRRRLLLPDEDNPAKLRHIEQKRLERNARIIASFGNATEMRIKHSVAHRREFVDKLIANEKIRSDELLAEEKKVLGYHCYEHFKEFIESCDDQKIAWKPKNTTTGCTHHSRRVCYFPNSQEHCHR
ncbi:hypothetical protein EJ05DRAFT_143291 [Pseudovirgaria hyperparasitica]|uniref:Uncharacterized protein n=1 Tax=Pseudovirgaria hyperparasitica TaxID=470096 RepID=A0A6A6VW75_9PEZI|nr:uncharacterized protein EJ05DRAFT_143291 [Pseudovirgaria hyperparasitica]KAF2754493.1 hypothetical protein EJ05DRAFT_143291 [Pseudovirgaria hyperparasitica]